MTLFINVYLEDSREDSINFKLYSVSICELCAKQQYGVQRYINMGSTRAAEATRVGVPTKRTSEVRARGPMLNRGRSIPSTVFRAWPVGHRWALSLLTRGPARCALTGPPVCKLAHRSTRDQ